MKYYEVSRQPGSDTVTVGRSHNRKVDALVASYDHARKNNLHGNVTIVRALSKKQALEICIKREILVQGR